MQTPFFSAPPPSFLPCRKTRGPKKKKKRSTAVALRGVYEGIYERPAGNYSARYQSQYQDYESFYANPLSLLLLLFFVFIVTAVKEGLRKLPEFLSSPPPPLPTRQRKLHRRDDPGRFSLSFSFPFFFRPPRTFSLILEPRALRGLEIGLGNWPRLIKRVLRARRGEREGRRFYCA